MTLQKEKWNLDPNYHPEPNRPAYGVLFVTLLLVAAGITLVVSSTKRAKLEFDQRSDYSHIRVRRTGNIRSLLFVRDDGSEVVESRINLDRPHEVMLAYGRGMFASYLFKEQQERVLIVGLGGGAMVHSISHHDPNVLIDAIEIDPLVVDVAREYFGVTTGPKINILTVDGFEYLGDTNHQYDVIYMDAFLKPAADTDRTGVPQRLKTIEFLKSIQTKLVPSGLVVFNLNSHQDTERDIQNIKDAFARTAIFDCPGSRNIVVVGMTSTLETDRESQVATANRLDARFKASFSFADVLSNQRLE